MPRGLPRMFSAISPLLPLPKPQNPEPSQISPKSFPSFAKSPLPPTRTTAWFPAFSSSPSLFLSAPRTLVSSSSSFASNKRRLFLFGRNLRAASSLPFRLPPLLLPRGPRVPPLPLLRSSATLPSPSPAFRDQTLPRPPSRRCRHSVEKISAGRRLPRSADAAALLSLLSGTAPCFYRASRSSFAGCAREGDTD